MSPLTSYENVFRVASHLPTYTIQSCTILKHIPHPLPFEHRAGRIPPSPTHIFFLTPPGITFPTTALWWFPLLLLLPLLVGRCPPTISLNAMQLMYVLLLQKARLGRSCRKYHTYIQQHRLIVFCHNNPVGPTRQLPL